MATEERQNPFSEFLRTFHDNPVSFVRDVLKVEPDPWQEELLTAVNDGTRRLSVRSGHGTGKSAVASWTMLWYLTTRYPVKIVVTAPTSAQLYDALFSETKRWFNELPHALQQCFDVKSDRIAHKSAPSDCFCAARVSKKEVPESLQGVHSENVLLVVDEASGIPETIFEAASGSMSGTNACTILLGNPTRSSGFFFDTHHRQAGEWWTRKVSCVDSPRVSDEYVREMSIRYGDQSNAYRVRVLGEFPVTDDDTIIGLELCQSAMDREVEVLEDEPIIWGLDVARFGSASSVLCKRQGRKVISLTRYKGLDLMSLSGAVMAEWESLLPRQQPTQVCVDSIGVGGGVVDRLRELGLPVVGINTSESPAMRQTYLNLRAELWFKVKAFLEGRDCQLPRDDNLVAELVSIKYKFTSSGRMQIESKSDAAKRGLASPDSGDALCLTFASQAATLAHGSSASSNWSEPLSRNLNVV